jgi:polysaccharide deacetylase family protein (PEP-CTERM system associated)
MIRSVRQLDGAFTVDVEDYFHVSAFADVVRPADWDHCESRVEASTRRILQLAARHKTRGTFFVLGWVAERFPQLVREIQSAGHEIGCHSHWHQLVYEQGPDNFRRDLLQARDTLQELTGEPVRAYRAPSFSITQRSLWALEILVESGFDTDASIYPIHHDRYGIPGFPAAPCRITTRSGTLREFPGPTSRVAGLNVPVGGGGYLRLLPWAVTAGLLRRVLKAERPLNIYVHPWEVDPDQPRIAASRRSRFRHYQNLSTTYGKLDRLMTEFRLGSMNDVFNEIPDLPAAEIPGSHSVSHSAPIGALCGAASSPEAASHLNGA